METKTLCHSCTFPILHSPEPEYSPAGLASYCLFQEACPNCLLWLPMNLIRAAAVALTTPEVIPTLCPY